AIVVVLHDPGVVAGGEVEELEAPFDAHDRARRKLPRRRDPHRADTAQPPRVPFDIEAMLVDGAGHESQASGQERLAQAPIVRILDADADAAVAEHANDEVEPLLRA